MKPKKIAFVDMAQKEAEIKYLTELEPYIGGVGVGIKLYEMHQNQDPVIFAVGPLNGFFPFASKTCVIVENQGKIEDLYLGGSLSFRIKYAGLDALVLLNSAGSETILEIENEKINFHTEETPLSSLGLPGKKSLLQKMPDNVVLDNYFEPRIHSLHAKFVNKKIAGVSITGTKIFEPENFDKYKDMYKKILGLKDRMKIGQSVNPSCSGCPLGCDLSRFGEIGGNVLLHSLVSCYLAENIYSDIGIVFACLDVLGYNYTHEEIENLPELISQTLKNL